MAFLSLREHPPSHLLRKTSRNKVSLLPVKFGSNCPKSAVSPMDSRGGKVCFVRTPRKTRKTHERSPTFVIFFILFSCCNSCFLSQLEAGRRGKVGPSFLARGVGSTRIYPLRERGRQERGRSRSSSRDAAGTPVKNSCSYVSAPSPWHQRGRTAGEMTENKEEWGRETEETSRKGKRKIFPCHLSLVK